MSNEFKPFPHQKLGIDWIIKNPNCALFWGMGSGKTVTTLTAISELIKTNEAKRVLIIAPKRVAENTWSTETEKWEHLKHLRISKVLGSKKDRENALKAEADLYIINRENTEWLVRSSPESGKWGFDMVIIDELSSFKNPQSKRFKALKSAKKDIKRVVGLTGTPRPNSIEDLWAEIFLLDNGERLGKFITHFRAEYLVPDKTNGAIVYSYLPKKGSEKRIYEKISDICMSVKKEDVINLEGQDYIDIPIELPKKLKKEYKKFEKDLVLKCLDGDGEIVASNKATLTNKLLQYASGAIYDENGTVHDIHTVKIETLQELIEAAGNENVLVLYNYKHEKDRIKKVFKCRELDTEQDIDDWNKGKISMAIAHPASIGHGLNLQYGGFITIWFSLNYSLELYQQANERLNRPGQKRRCKVFHIIANDTHDERVLMSLKNKDDGQSRAIEALKAEVLGGRI